METTFRAKQKEEAVKRLKLLGITPAAIRKFEETGEVSSCLHRQREPESTPGMVQTMIRELEREYGFLVYLNVRLETCCGMVDNLFFVGKYEAEWESQVADLEDGYSLVYAYNWSYPINSEMGSIAFRRTERGGLVRVQ